MRYIIRTGYFMSSFLLKNIHDSVVIDVSTFLDVTEKEKRTYIHKLFKYKIMPVCFFIMAISYRFFFKTLEKETLEKDEVLYFSIDRMDVLSKLAWRYRTCQKQALWLWNPSPAILRSSRQFKFFVRLIKLSGIDIWSFDESDSEKYALNYHPQIYTTSVSERNNTREYVYDVLFIGQDKGRFNEIKKINDALCQANMRAYIHMIKDATGIYNEDDNAFLKVEPVSYEENLSLIKKSKALIDIVQQNQTGLTLRTLEAVFYNKLLVTNNKNIVNYDFYNPDLIFILDENYRAEALIDFLNKNREPDGSRFKNSDSYDVRHLLKTVFDRN